MRYAASLNMSGVAHNVSKFHGEYESEIKVDPLKILKLTFKLADL